jgi:hypothetical protein
MIKLNIEGVACIIAGLGVMCVSNRVITDHRSKILVELEVVDHITNPFHRCSPPSLGTSSASGSQSEYKKLVEALSTLPTLSKARRVDCHRPKSDCHLMAVTYSVWQKKLEVMHKT